MRKEKKQITKLENYINKNIIVFFFNFFLFSLIYKSNLNNSNLAQNIIKILPILNSNTLSLVSICLFIIETIIHLIINRHLVKKIDELANTIHPDKEIELTGALIKKENNYQKDYSHHNIFSKEAKIKRYIKRK